MELESQVQEAEALNQTLTAAYQELKAELDRLEWEKYQEQQPDAPVSQSGSSFDPFYNAPNSNSYDYGQEDVSWGESNWTPEEWDFGEEHNPQG